MSWKQTEAKSKDAITVLFREKVNANSQWVQMLVVLWNRNIKRPVYCLMQQKKYTLNDFHAQYRKCGSVSFRLLHWGNWNLTDRIVFSSIFLILPLVVVFNSSFFKPQLNVKTGNLDRLISRLCTRKRRLCSVHFILNWKCKITFW